MLPGRRLSKIGAGLRADMLADILSMSLNEKEVLILSELKPREKQRFWENQFLQVFLLGLGLSFLVFLPFILIDGGRFLFYGDFNVQQIPFYQVAHAAVRSGNLGWNAYTDLGVNFIGSYSFYLLGSPFFWLTIPFPEAALPYLMGPLLMLKFAFAALTGYVYLHRYVKNRNHAVLGAVLYAFSGFSVYNVFFNHFHEAILTFPLMLAALDEYIYTRRRGPFALTVALCCVVNYYFFVGQVTFALIYFFLRLLCKSFRISLPDLLLLLLEAVLGVGLACVLLLPSVDAILQNGRTDNLINGWNALLYNHNQRYLHIFESLFFPPDLPARPNFTPDSESKWASLGAWLPLFGMSGVIGWLQIRRKHWLKKFLWILFFMAAVPFLNASFQLFNSSFYGRWYYMLTLMLSLATVLALEYPPVNWRRAITWNGVIVIFIAACIGFMPTITRTETGDKSYSFGLMAYPTRFWTYVAISLCALALVVFLFQYSRDTQTRSRTALRLSCAVSVLYALYFIALGKTQSLDPRDHILPYALNGGVDVNLPDMRDDALRVDFYDSLDNSAMFWDVKSIQAFHSIVPGATMDFYKAIGVQRDVASRPGTDVYALRGLTSVKWLFDDDHDDTYFAGENNSEPLMPGFLYHGNANGFDIWENEAYVPMGFSYDYYVSQSTFDKTPEVSRINLLMKAILLDDAQIERYQGILSPLPEDQQVYTKTTYLQDCTNRRRQSGTGFHYTQNGFISEVNTAAKKQESLIFFSVPYEPGWRAKVNGEPAEIQRVNVGFMAVAVPVGEKVIIEFSFRTPGLVLGAAVTGISFLVLLLYLNRTRQIAKHRVLTVPPKQPLQVKPFQVYLDRHHTSFNHPRAMSPKEFRTSPPPDPPEPPA